MKLMNSFRKTAAFGAVLLAWGVVSGAALAQESLSASHIEAAKKVVEETKATEPFDEILPLLASQTQTAFVQSDPTRAEEIVEVVQGVALKLAGKRAELNQQVYSVWAEKFTEDELNKLAEFYSTPLGAKLRDSIPEVTAKSLTYAREWQDMISTEMVTLVQEELTKDNTAQ